MKLVQYNNCGTYGLQAENRRDMLDLRTLMKDQMVSQTVGRKVEFQVWTLGAEKADDNGESLPIRIQLQVQIPEDNEPNKHV